MNIWDGQTTELRDQSEFARRLAFELEHPGHIGQVAVRNFSLQTFELDDCDGNIMSVDRLALVVAGEQIVAPTAPCGTPMVMIMSTTKRQVVSTLRKTCTPASPKSRAIAT